MPGVSLTFFDPLAGISGVGFELRGRYLVLSSDDLNWEGRLTTRRCDLTYRLADFSRMEQLANEYGATMPDTALHSAPNSPWQAAGIVMLLFALASGIARRSRGQPVFRRTTVR